MPRYFIEVCYKGTAYSGFQIQKNSVTIQSEVQKALSIFFKRAFTLTGASRTDAGVHALQNYFHFDADLPLTQITITDRSRYNNTTGSFYSSEEDVELDKFLYNINAILPLDIVVKRIYQVEDNAHCRFDAVLREYKYFIYKHKNPFLQESAYYYPYALDITKLNEAATLLLENEDFTSFSKKNTQSKSFICDIQKSEWIWKEPRLIYNVKARRFLRGMVKGMVGTMLRVGTGKIDLNEFTRIIQKRDCSKSDFSVPSHALFLIGVKY
ncbi:MAG: tRNA pseudouridine(38-40) synthase TruA [Ginsengibacter sp.]